MSVASFGSYLNPEPTGLSTWIDLPDCSPFPTTHKLFYYYFLSPSNVAGGHRTHCMERVWATIVFQGTYIPGALVLAHCLEVVKSRYPLVVLDTPTLSQQTRTLLARVGVPYVERTGLSPSREQHEHVGWFRVKSPTLFLWVGENKRMWVARTTYA